MRTVRDGAGADGGARVCCRKHWRQMDGARGVRRVALSPGSKEDMLSGCVLAIRGQLAWSRKVERLSSLLGGSAELKICLFSCLT